jgi:sodium transport system permease protein
MILFTLLTSVVLIVTLLSVASTFAKSVKEATSAIGPFALIPVLVGVMTMFAGASTGNPALYFIPIYNSVRVLGEIFSFVGSPLLVVITCLSNLAWSAILAIAISKMFNNERIMFNK